MRARWTPIVLALAALPTLAFARAGWPPPPETMARMKELQRVLGDREASAGQREAAREELSSMLKSPAGQSRGRTPDEKPQRPARAAIDPVPTTVIPSPNNSVPMPGVAKLEVVDPPKPLIDPRSGQVMPQVGAFTVDPRTGNVLHSAPGGAIDPRTGQFHPR